MSKTQLALCSPLLFILNAAAAAAQQGFLLTPDGVHLHYHVVGTGPTTVLIPGRLFLEARLRALANGRRLVFYDTRSRGLSDAVRDSTRETIQDDVRDMEAVRRRFGAERVSIIGWSYMGLLSALYAKEYPAHVKRLVQIDPVPMTFDVTYPPSLAEPYSSGVDSIEAANLDSLRRSGFDRTNPEEYCLRDWAVNRYALVGDRRHVGRLTADGRTMCRLQNEWPINLDRHVDASIASIKTIHWSAADLAVLNMPVLIIHGRRDRNAPYGAGREWALRLPDARLLTVAGAAHSSFDEVPGIVLPAIDTFLRGAWPAHVERITTLEP